MGRDRNYMCGVFRKVFFRYWQRRVLSDFGHVYHTGWRIRDEEKLA